jgi:hypothetical protein
MKHSVSLSKEGNEAFGVVSSGRQSVNKGETKGPPRKRRQVVSNITIVNSDVGGRALERRQEKISFQQIEHKMLASVIDTGHRILTATQSLIIFSAILTVKVAFNISATEIRRETICPDIWDRLATVSINSRAHRRRRPWVPRDGPRALG